VKNRRASSMISSRESTNLQSIGEQTKETTHRRIATRTLNLRPFICEIRVCLADRLETRRCILDGQYVPGGCNITKLNVSRTWWNGKYAFSLPAMAAVILITLQSSIDTIRQDRQIHAHCQCAVESFPERWPISAIACREVAR
jgi:hypothetical protein